MNTNEKVLLLEKALEMLHKVYNNHDTTKTLDLFEAIQAVESFQSQLR